MKVGSTRWEYQVRAVRIISILWHTMPSACACAGHSGSLCDSFSWHDNMKFSTTDSDNDLWKKGNCAKIYSGGGYWHGACYRSFLTGKYHTERQTVVYGTGISWSCHKGYKYSFKKAEIKIFVPRHLIWILFSQILVRAFHHRNITAKS